MPDKHENERRVIESALSAARKTDATTQEGATMLWSILAGLIVVDYRGVKKKGTRSEPIRALPPYDTFRNHEGIRIKQLRALKLEDGFWVRDVRTSKHFVNELTRAYESQSFTWTRIDGSIATIVWRFFERGGVPFKDRGQMCKYLTVSESELDSDRITTLDASITGPALEWIIETVGLGYLGERGDEASRAFS